MRLASRALLLALSPVVLLWSQAEAPAAPSASDQKKLKKYLNSRAYVNKLRFVVARYEANVNGCKSPKIAGRTGVKMLKAPVAMPDIGVPKSGQWIDTVRVEGCGKPFRRKVIAAKHGSEAVMFPYLAGSTRTTPKLQFETMKLVLAAERKRSTKAGCKKKSLLKVSNSKFVAQAKMKHGTMWRETWTVKNCKGQRKVGILFTPDKRGKIQVSLE
ncbi:MAG: hypothetical protein AAGF86_14685 [Pseudomonadota bacterium]